MGRYDGSVEFLVGSVMRPRPWWAIALIAGVVYVALLPPVSGMGDSSEFTLVLAKAGVAHPTGYPLYTLIGHVFVTFLHAAGIGWSLAASLWSALGATVALFLLGALATEMVAWVPGASPGARLLAPLVPLALFAFQPVLLDEATRAEINTWNLAWSCGAALVLVRLIEPSGLASRRDSARGAAALWGLMVGLGLAHHGTSVLVLVPLTVSLIAVLARRRLLARSLVGPFVVAASVPIASYAFIAWRAWHPSPVQWPLLQPNLTSVLRHMAGGGYRHYLGRFAPTPFENEVLRGGVYPFLFPGLGLLVWIALREREPDRRRVAWGLFMAALFVAVFTFSYGVPDPAPYFLPAMALGIAAAAPSIARIPGMGSRRAGGVVAVALVACLVAIVPWVRDGGERRAATIAFENVIRSMWSSIPPDTAIVSWTDDRFNRLLEYQVLRGEKTALLIVTPDMMTADPIRRVIRTRFGADPLEGFEPVRIAAAPRAGTADEQRVLNEARWRLLRGLSDRIRVPVILFDPTVPIVWQFRKPWEPRSASDTGMPPIHGVHPSSASPNPGD